MVVAQMHPDEPDDDADVVIIDANSITLGELEHIEDITGRNVVAELGRGQPSARTMTALLYVFKKRTDPSFTLEEARLMNVQSFRVEAPNDPKETAG